MRGFYSLLIKECLLALALVFVLLMPSSHEPKPIASGLTPTAYSVANKRGFIAGDYLAARFAERHQDPSSAADYYLAALGADARNQDLLRRTYTLLAFSGNMDQASHLAERQVKESAKSDIRALARLVAALNPIQQNDFHTARELLNVMEVNTPFTPETLTQTALLPMLAWCDTMAGKPEQAAALLALVPDGKEKIFTSYQGILASAATGNKGQVLAQLEAIDLTGQPHRMVDKAVSLYRQYGEATRADELIASFRKTDPDYAYREPATGTREQQALTGMAEALFEMAARAYRANSPDDATVFLRMALYLNPSFDDAKLLLAHTLEQTKLDGEALGLYQNISENSRFYWQAQLASAAVLNRIGRAEDAKTLLLALADRRPKDHDALLLLGDILLSGSKYDEASTIYTRALERIGEPKAEDWPILYARGICFEQAGLWEKAEADLQKALELSPNQPSVLNYLAYSWLMLDKNVEKAESMLRVAVAKQPGDAHILDSYGWALYKLGLYSEALIFMERATMLMPEDATTNDHLGDGYWRLGRTTEAKYQWRKALAFEPPAKDRASIQMKLDQGLAPVSPLALAQ